MESFLSDRGVLIAVVCALLAVAYGVVTTRSLLALSPGNETMQRLSAAVQEGAQAYLKRQYTVIGAVGAGGIGLKLLEAMGTNSDWDKVAYMVLLILVVVFVFDNISNALRSRLIGPRGH